MDNASNHKLDHPSQGRLDYLWDVYKYRHGLCWKAVYKIIGSVLVLAVLPYAKPDLMEHLEYWLLVPSVIGTLLAVFGIFVVNNELRLFSQVKVAHHDLQEQFIESYVKNVDARKIAIDGLKPECARWTLFDIYVHSIMIILCLLSLGNTLFLVLWWIPSYAV